MRVRATIFSKQWNLAQRAYLCVFKSGLRAFFEKTALHLMQKDNYTLLIEKIDAFTRKFYVNRLLRGSLYTVAVVLGLFIVLNVLEYYFYFSTGVRTAMLWGFIGLSLTALYRWVGLPLMHYFRLGKIISHEQAAIIIGNHFADVKDKLLNILQLRRQSHNAIYAELINASINQKSNEIRLAPFTAAIDLRRNRKYLRYALPPVLLLLFLLLGAPNILREGAMRLWNSNTYFEKPAPFRYLLDEDDLIAIQFSDYELKVAVDGNALPNDVFINLGEVQYRMNKIASDTFAYKFVNIQRDLRFSLSAAGVNSRDYTLKVIRKPGIVNFDARIEYPAYTGRTSETLSNVGDLIVPQGATIRWTFQAQNTGSLSLQFGPGDVVEANRSGRETYSYTRRIMRDGIYKIFLQNPMLPKPDSVAYVLSVIPDLHPQISVEEFKDSANLRLLYFTGEASDDYGLGGLSFNYQIKKAKTGQGATQSVKIEKPTGKQIRYSYVWDLRNLDLQPGDEINYYFEIYDNDGLNGAKSSRTQTLNWRMPSLDEVRNQQNENSEEIRKDLEKALKESAKIQEELKKLRNKVLQQKELDWQTRKDMERLLQRQKQLQQQLQQAQQNLEQNMKLQQEFNQQSEEILQKQEQLQKLMEDVLSEDIKKLMEDIEKLLQEMNRDEMLEKAKEMEMSNEDVNKELDRLLELYKRMEVDELLEQQIEQLNELAKEQDELARESEKGEKPAEELAKEQEKLNQKMEDLRKQHEEMLQKNAELKKPKNIEDQKDGMKDAEKDMKDSNKDLDGNQKGDASKKQKKAAQKMREMANKMQQDKEQGEMDQMEEDIAMLRQLLKNLVSLSFNQENTMNATLRNVVNTPRFVELTQQQFRVRDDFRIVEDSLRALASRNSKIEGMITDKISEIKTAMRKSQEEMEERRVNTANEHQQRSMKGLNDLALLLSDALQQMQMDMDASGEGSCSKPGGKGKGKGKQSGDNAGKSPSDKISKGQEDLNKIMKDLKERLEKGNSGGMGGQPSTSQEFAKMARQQAELRNALRELQKQKQEQGKGSKALDEIMKEMDKVETDLVNKRLTNETLKRQQEILTRLLEEERAEREREQDEKRQAEAARQQTPKMPPSLEEYIRRRQAEVEQFRTVSPALKPFYKQLVEEYVKGGR